MRSVNYCHTDSLVHILGPVDRRNRRRQLAPARLGRVPHHLQLCVRRLGLGLGLVPHHLELCVRRLRAAWLANPDLTLTLTPNTTWNLAYVGCGRRGSASRRIASTQSRIRWSG